MINMVAEEFRRWKILFCGLVSRRSASSSAQPYQGYRVPSYAATCRDALPPADQINASNFNIWKSRGASRR